MPDEAQAPPTIHDVARRAGVSIATVSRVLRRSAPSARRTAERVHEAAAELGYHPRRTERPPASTRQGALAVVLPDLNTPGMLELWHGCEAAASERSLQLVLLTTSARPDAMSSLTALTERVDGFVLADATLPDSAAASLSRVSPVALIGRPLVPGCLCVGGAEIARATSGLTDHLIRHGRRNLTFVGDPDGSPALAEHYRGFRLAHAAAGLRLRRPPLRMALTERGGAQVAQEVLRRRVKVDALVCGSDITAVSLVRAMQAHGTVVPDDIAVVGIGDIRAARYLTPGLTTLRPSMTAMGRLGVERLHAAIMGQHEPEGRLAHEFELVRRASCGCPPARSRPRG